MRTHKFENSMLDNTSTLQILIKLRDEASAALSGFQKKVGGLDATLGAAATKVAGFGAAFATAGAILGVKTAAEIETTRAGLVTLLGSVEKADRTIRILKDEAARTPFEFNGLAQATQLLSSVTKDGEQSIKIILDIGEALAGMGKGQVELDRIIVNLQQIGAIGHASMVDIKQFAYAGIPIFEMLQKETGLAGDALADFISDGSVSFEMLTEMFDKANDEGGQFFEAFKNQSGTFNQSMSNMKDVVSMSMADIVKDLGLYEGVKHVMQGITDALNNNKNTIRDYAYTFRFMAQSVVGGLVGLTSAWYNLLSKVGMAKQEHADALNKMQADIRKEVDETIKLFNETGNANNEVNTSLQGTGDAGKKAYQAVAQQASDAADKIKEANKAIEGTKEKINELIESHQKEVSNTRQSYAKAIVDQETNVKDLKRKIREEEDADKKEELQKQYLQEKQALDSKRVLFKIFSDEVVEERRRNALTDFEREVEDIYRRMIEQQKEHDKKMELLQKELAENEEKRAKLNIIEQGISADLKAELDTRYQSITEYVEKSLTMLEKMQKAKERAVAGIDRISDMAGTSAIKKATTKKVSDAIIKPSGDIISTHPRDWLIATQNPMALATAGAGNVTINIGNVNGTDRDAARQLADMIAQEIKYRVRL